MDQIERFVRNTINEKIALPIPITSIGNYDDLNIYGLDDVNIVRISVELEKKFGIMVPDEFIINKSEKTISDFCVCVRDGLERVKV